MRAEGVHPGHFIHKSDNTCYSRLSGSSLSSLAFGDIILKMENDALDAAYLKRLTQTEAQHYLKPVQDLSKVSRRGSRHIYIY